MGITIHFQGNLKNTNMIHSLMDELVDISKTMDWKYHILDEDWSKPSTAKLSYTDEGTEILGHLALKGISINLHPDSESFSLYFDANGMLTTPIGVIMVSDGSIKKEHAGSSVKTQFAPPDVHISIIKLLKYLKKKYIPDLKVYDEGEYWETENREKLVEKIDFLNHKMDLVEAVLSDIEIENADKLTTEQLVDRLEAELRKRLGGDK